MTSGDPKRVSTRATMLEVLNEDYVRTAYAKGLATRNNVARCLVGMIGHLFTLPVRLQVVY